MKNARRALILWLIAAMLHLSMSGLGTAQPPPLESAEDGITQNEPQILCSQGVYFAGSGDPKSASVGGKALWLALGAVVLAGLVVGAGGAGGGSDSGGSANPSTVPTGSVSFDW